MPVDSAKIIAQINQDLFDAQQVAASSTLKHDGQVRLSDCQFVLQKLVKLTDKNKKLSGENKKLKQEVCIAYCS